MDLNYSTEEAGFRDEVRGWLGVTPNELPLFAADLGSDAGWAEAAAGASTAPPIELTPAPEWRLAQLG